MHVLSPQTTLQRNHMCTNKCIWLKAHSVKRGRTTFENQLPRAFFFLYKFKLFYLCGERKNMDHIHTMLEGWRFLC